MVARGCMKKSFTFILFCLFLTTHVVQSAEKSTPESKKLKPIQQLLGEEKTRQKGIKKLRSLALKKKESVLKHKSIALLSETYREDGKLEKLSLLVKSYDDFEKISKRSTFKLKTSYLLPFLESAHFKAIAPSKPQVQSALEMLNYAEQQTVGLGQIRTLIKYGEVLRDLDKFSQSEIYLQKAMTYGNNFFKETRPDYRKPGYDEWQLLKVKINDLLFLLNFDFLEAEFGELYALYVKFRSLYDLGKYTECQVECEKIIEKGANTVYGAAAKLYHAYCTGKLGDFRTEEKELQAFIKEAPYQVYRGRAWLALARINLEEYWNAEKAKFFYKKALDWFKYVRARKDAIEIYTVPAKVKTVSKPGEKVSGLDGWNRRTFRKISPKEIINHTNSNWYINEYEKQCVVMLGFFCFYDGDFKKAKEYFSEVGKFDSDLAGLKAKHIFNALSRLEAATNVGRMTFTEEEKKPLRNKKAKLLISYAELNCLMEQFKKAEELYSSIIKNSKSTGYEKAIAYVGLGLVCDIQGEKREIEIQCYKNALLLINKRQALHDNASFGLCLAIKGNLEEQLEAFEQYFRDHPNGKYAKELYIRKIYRLIIYQKFEQARSSLREFVKKYPDLKGIEDLANILKSYLNDCNGNPATEINPNLYKGLEKDFKKYLEISNKRKKNVKN